MKKLIVLLVLIALLATTIPAHADGIAADLQISCDNWTRNYQVQISTWAADMGAWNSYTLPSGCYLMSSTTVAAGYSMSMYRDYWTYQTIVKVTR